MLETSRRRVREPKPKPKPKPKPEVAKRDPAPIVDIPTAPVGFPKLEVASIRWHPDPERREAIVIYEGAREVEAREGDIVAGIAIKRIDPSADEFGMGASRKRIRIEP